MARAQWSIAARLAASYGLLLMLAVSILSAVFYISTVGVLERGADVKLRATAERLFSAYDVNRPAAILEAITAELADGIDSDKEVFVLLNAEGRVLGGNREKWRKFGFDEGSLDTVRIKRREQHTLVRVVWRQFSDGNRLVVAFDMQELMAVRQLVVHALLVGAVIALALVVGGMGFFRLRLEHRIGDIRRITREVEGGDLSRRMPVQGDDEFSRLAADINAMLERIEQLMHGVRNVSNAIAHDLRTPLTRLRGHLEDTLQRASSAAELRDSVASATVGIDELIVLFDKLLQIAESEAGVRGRGFVSVDLNRIAEDMVDLYDAAAEEQGASLVLRERDGEPTLGDHDLLASAVSSLIDNALKYAGEGAHIEVSVTSDEHTVVLAVRDHGPGIPADHLPHVTERFYRVDRSRGTAGNGLGLSIVTAIAKLHDGRLELSDAAPGLLARLVLPRRQAPL